MAEREVDDDTAAALDLLDAVAGFTGESPAALLYRALLDILGPGADQADAADSDDVLTPGQATVDPGQQIPVFMTYRGQRTEGRFSLDPLSLSVETGPDSVVGITYSSPSKAARAVIAAWNPERTSPVNGWHVWRMVDGGERLDILRQTRVLATTCAALGASVEPSPQPLTPQEARQPVSVSLRWREHVVMGLFVPATQKLAVLSGAGALDGLTYASPTSAARAVLSVLDSEADPTADYDGWRLWRLTAGDEQLAVIQQRLRVQQTLRRRGRTPARHPPSPPVAAAQVVAPGEVRVSMVHHGQYVYGRIMPGTGRMIIDAGPDSIVGKSFSSPSSAASAVITAVRGGEQVTHSPRNGWLAWRDENGLTLAARFPQRSRGQRRVTGATWSSQGT